MLGWNVDDFLLWSGKISLAPSKVKVCVSGIWVRSALTWLHVPEQLPLRPAGALITAAGAWGAEVGPWGDCWKKGGQGELGPLGAGRLGGNGRTGKGPHRTHQGTRRGKSLWRGYTRVSESHVEHVLETSSSRRGGASACSGPAPQAWVSDSRAHSRLLGSRVPGGLSAHLSLCPAGSVTGGGIVEGGSPSWHMPHAAEMSMV